MKNQYTITITQLVTENKMSGKQWTVVGENETGRSLYGYTPEIETEVSTERTIYKQVIDGELDVFDVITAVNHSWKPTK
jgi:hypothetical protein